MEIPFSIPNQTNKSIPVDLSFSLERRKAIVQISFPILYFDIGNVLLLSNCIFTFF